MAFPEFGPSHDPNGQEDWTFPFKLAPGEQIVSQQVDEVDSTSTTLSASPELTISPVTAGKIATGQTYDLWGVTAWITGGTAGTTYYLRCRIATDSTPQRRADCTRQLRCAQT
jgi:hypothetical protein